MDEGKLENPVATQRPEGKLENPVVAWRLTVEEGKLENPVVTLGAYGGRGKAGKPRGNLKASRTRIHLTMLR